MPHNGVYPIVVSAAIIQALQTVVSRTIEPVEGGVVTIGGIESSGHAHNVIPASVRMLGTTRWFAPEVGDQIEQSVRALVTGIATSFGAEATLLYERLYPATINDPAANALARRAATTVQGEARVMPLPKPTMGGEDFSFMLNAKQGAYLMLGTGGGPNVHHPQYDFNDTLLPIGASWYVTLAEQILKRS